MRLFTDHSVGDTVLPNLPQGKCRVQLCKSEEMYLVQEDDVEKVTASFAFALVFTLVSNKK